MPENSRKGATTSASAAIPSRRVYLGSIGALNNPGDGNIPFVYAGITALLLVIFIADYFTPLGVTVWVLYMLPVALSLWLWSPLTPVLIAALVTSMMTFTYITDAPAIDPFLAGINRGFGILTMWVTAFVGFFFVRNKLVVHREQWLQSAEGGMTEVVVGEQTVQQLGSSVLRYLSESLEAPAGALFVSDRGSFKRSAAYGVPLDGGTPTEFSPEDGLLGRAVKEGSVFLVEELPDGYLSVGSALGKGSVRHLLVAPLTADGMVVGVIEMGFLKPVDRAALQLLERVSEFLGVALRAAIYREHLQRLLEETQRQAEELQAQGEELRVSNEELEEQSRALKESQLRLEEQQAELEQTNSQLERQADLLEAQKAQLQGAKSSLEDRTRELEQASRYKSDFLANMSHELRTPLNSSLILAKLLADNPLGNLNEEQVRYAHTIQASGNDLLALINDVLDLSKIEAGHMQILAQEFRVSELADGMTHVFRPMAQQKGLTFRVEMADEVPATMESDWMRLEQVLKNLLSNALKFTEQGEVVLAVGRLEGNRVSFAVTDTGIGIPEHQQRMIFEAFRQADGTTNRKYGGTGLGLSISKELVRLLGGDIQVWSESGRGSVFTVIVPERYDPKLAAEQPRNEPTPPTEAPRSGAASVRPMPPPREPMWQSRSFADDRELLNSDRRVILVVEDDQSFARILFDLAHELDFQCLVAMTAEEGLAVAVQYLPHAVLLDVGLPDHSGLSVLDRLKRDSRTRHIPVHVVSAGDYAQTALSLGAVGHMLKPVKREDITEALSKLESRLAQRLRRVLVVEDDPVQLESLGHLLGSREVETVGAKSAAECLEQLKNSTFDCMVLDLTLPDASGYSLLETLSREDTYSFPPAIVYTGRDLSSDEEQRLRKYSKSIIIKGAKSPERLLDEVTLFLHQVVSELPIEQQRMLEQARSRDVMLEGRRILVVEDDVRNVFAVTSILEPRGVKVEIARNGREALEMLERLNSGAEPGIDLVLMDVMMPEMDGLTATREIRKRPEWAKLPILMLTAKAMRDDQERCLAAGANDYMAKPLDVEKLLSLVRVWMPR